MYKVFGFINLGLLMVVISQFCVRLLNQWVFHSKAPGYYKLMKVLRALHKPAAALLFVSIIIHGYLALGAFRLHTGTVAGTSFLVTGAFGLAFYLTKKPVLLTCHRAMAILSVVLVAVHLVVPKLFSFR